MPRLVNAVDLNTCRWQVWIGSTILGLAYVFVGVLQTTNVCVFCLVFAPCQGIGIGLAYVMPMCLVIQYFPKHKGASVGVCMMGAGVGPMFWIKSAGEYPGLLELYGISHTFKIFGLALLIVCNTAAIVLVPPVFEIELVDKQNTLNPLGKSAAPMDLAVIKDDVPDLEKEETLSSPSPSRKVFVVPPPVIVDPPPGANTPSRSPKNKMANQFSVKDFSLKDLSESYRVVIRRAQHNSRKRGRTDYNFSRTEMIQTRAFWQTFLCLVISASAGLMVIGMFEVITNYLHYPPTLFKASHQKETINYFEAG